MASMEPLKGPYTCVNKSALFSDQSGSSRVDRIKKAALDDYKKSQPKSGPVKNELGGNDRREALTRVRAGGYVPTPKIGHTKSNVHAFGHA